ncbi:MAG: hypothetical protein K2N63_13230 [Lachnospiraceae bacterium]|nr:hypothetical protein [Lachnospiraceae bacterium]
MKKSYKVILLCVCVALIFVLLGFGIGRMTNTTQTTDSNQGIHASNSNTGSKAGDSSQKNSVDNTESGIKDNSPDTNFDNTQGKGNGVEVRFKDGNVWTIFIDPSLLGDDFDWDNYDFDWTGDHE